MEQETVETNVTMQQDITKKAKAKRTSPKELFAEFYGKKLSMNPKLQNLRIGKAEEIPASLIAYNRQRMLDALKVVKRLKADIGAYRYALKTRSIQDGDTIVMIDEFTSNMIRAKKARAQAELIEATEKYKMFKEFLESAIDSARMRDIEFINRSNEQAYIKRMAPSLAVKWTERIKKNGSFTPMKESAVAGSQKEFREMFSEFVTKHESEKEKQFADKPKLFTKVMELVMDKLVEEAKKEKGSPSAKDETKKEQDSTSETKETLKERGESSDATKN